MADHFPFKCRCDDIIAVTGLPYTFREEMGRNIANWAECPSLKFEVILNALPNQLAGAGARDDAAFDILCETALSLLKERNKFSCVVINFPIPTNPQLHTLLCLVDNYTYPHRLLIIECQRRNMFRWRKDVEYPTRGIWYNLRYNTGNRVPGKWEDVDKAILNHQQQRLDDYFVTLSQRYAADVDVKKLVVDPFEDLRARDFTEDKGLDPRSLLAQAIKHYLSCDADEYEELSVNSDYSVWRRQWLEHWASSRGRGRGATTTEPHWCRPGDCILRFTNKLLLEEADAICGACEQKITYNNSTEGEGEGAYYYCQFCSLCLHELCALAESPTAITAKNTNPHSRVVSNYARGWSWRAFKGSTHACHSCEKADGKQFSQGCDACIFRTHLKCQLLPTALKHSCDQHHFLSIRLSSWDGFFNAIYDCKACGLRGSYSSYCCNICNAEYHLECVLDMPLHTKTKEIVHGGHTHSIDIHFSCGQREYEYKWCCVCYDDINPDTWVYICQDCDFIAHLYCFFPSKTLGWYKRISLVNVP